MIEQFNLSNNPCYKELLNSEKSYLDNFLFYLNEQDINTLLLEFDNHHTKIEQADAKQEKLRQIYNLLKHLRVAQRDVLCAFHEASPQIWLNLLNELYPLYQSYFSLSHNFLVPKEIDDKFKEIQSAKLQQGLPSPGSLGAILIAPIQRFPRYVLLAKELHKHLIGTDACTQLFKENLSLFIQGLIALNHRLNNHMLSLDQEIIREKLKNLQEKESSSVTSLLSLSDDLCLLESDELIERLKHFNFSHCPQRDLVAISAHKNKFTLLLSQKIFQDKHPEAASDESEKEPPSPYSYLLRKPL